jgi:hypothetical protein
MEAAFKLSLEGFDFLFEGVIKANLELLRHVMMMHWHLWNHLHLLRHHSHLLLKVFDESWFIHWDTVFTL